MRCWSLLRISPHSAPLNRIHGLQDKRKDAQFLVVQTHGSFAPCSVTSRNPSPASPRPSGFMDYKTTEWTHIFSPDGLFCCGHTILDSGDVVVVGGHQANAGYPVRLQGVRCGVRCAVGPGAWLGPCLW